jgi:hypothetical protein
LAVPHPGDNDDCRGAVVAFFPFSFRFRRDEPVDVSPVLLPVSAEPAPARSLILPVDRELFLAQLKQAVASTELLMKDVPDEQWDYAAVFRRSSNPDHPPAFMPEGGVVHLDPDVFYEPHDIGLALAAVVKGRKGVLPASWEDILLKGKIVAHEICATLADGAGEAVTNGYTDVYDLPPVDTWIYLAYPERKVNPVLYCWVPDPFVQTMQDAIDVSAAELFEWADIAQLLPDYYS